jgi:hypothetical protein
MFHRDPSNIRQHLSAHAPHHPIHSLSLQRDQLERLAPGINTEVHALAGMASMPILDLHLKLARSILKAKKA